MLAFIDTRQSFTNDCQALGVSPQVTSILSKIKDHTQKSVSVLTHSISAVVNRGGGLLPSVEIQCNRTGNTLAKTNVGYWDYESDFLACAFTLLDECNLDDDTLSEAQETLNLLMSDCLFDECNLDDE